MYRNDIVLHKNLGNNIVKGRPFLVPIFSTYFQRSEQKVWNKRALRAHKDATFGTEGAGGEDLHKKTPIFWAALKWKSAIMRAVGGKEGVGGVTWHDP